VANWKRRTQCLTTSHRIPGLRSARARAASGCGQAAGARRGRRLIALVVGPLGRVVASGRFVARRLGSAAAGEAVVVAHRFGVAVVAVVGGWGRVRMMAVACWRRVC
jgi:hypothetical protein